MKKNEEAKKIRKLIYILECLRKNQFCCLEDGKDCSDEEIHKEIFRIGIKNFLISKSGRKVKKVVKAFKTLNNGFEKFKGDMITPQIFNKVNEFMQGYFPQDEFFNMKFTELRGPESQN